MIHPECREEYCKAFYTWFELMKKQIKADINNSETSADRIKGLQSDLDALDRTFLYVTKSSLLARMIYNGEELRTTPCFLHNGRWSGCLLPSDCPCCGEGWYRNGVTVEQEYHTSIDGTKKIFDFPVPQTEEEAHGHCWHKNGEYINQFGHKTIEVHCCICNVKFEKGEQYYQEPYEKAVVWHELLKTKLPIVDGKVIHGKFA